MACWVPGRCQGRRYPSHLFLTAYATQLDTATGELAASELAAFITRRALVTVRKDDGLDIGAVIGRWDARPELARFGDGYLLYGLLDYIVDTSSRRRRAWMTSPSSWRTSCSTTFRIAWTSSGAASSCARAWCCCAGWCSPCVMWSTT